MEMRNCFLIYEFLPLTKGEVRRGFKNNLPPPPPSKGEGK